MRSAEIAAILREKMLSEMLEKVEAGEGDAVEALSLLSSEALKLFKDSEGFSGEKKLRHELRTPINAIKGYGEMVLEDMALMDQRLPPMRCKRAERETVQRMRSKPVTRN